MNLVKKGKKKEPALPLDFIQEVSKMSKDQVVKRFIQEENDIKGIDLQKKQDTQLSDLKKQIKERELVLKEKIDELKEQIKTMRDEDSELVELKEDKKALEGGYNSEKKRRKAFRDHLYKQVQLVFQF